LIVKRSPLIQPNSHNSYVLELADRYRVASIHNPYSKTIDNYAGYVIYITMNVLSPQKVTRCLTIGQVPRT